MKFIIVPFLLISLFGGMASYHPATASYAAQAYTAPAQAQSLVLPEASAPLAAAESPLCIISLAGATFDICQIMQAIIGTTFALIGQNITNLLAGMDQQLYGIALLHQIPTNLTTGNNAVIAFTGFATELANASLVIFVLFIGGRLLIRFGANEVETLWDTVPRLLLGALGANLALWGVGQMILFLNIVTTSVVTGTLSLPFYNASTAGAYTPLVILGVIVYLVLFLLLFLQLLMRLALLDLLIILSPLAVVCWILPETRGIAFWWSRLFGATIVVQPMQIVLVSLGIAFVNDATLLNPLFGAMTLVVQVALLIATLFLAIRLPQILQYSLGQALRGTDSLSLGKELLSVVTWAVALAGGISIGAGGEGTGE